MGIQNVSQFFEVKNFLNLVANAVNLFCFIFYSNYTVISFCNNFIAMNYASFTLWSKKLKLLYGGLSCSTIVFFGPYCTPIILYFSQKSNLYLIVWCI